MFKKYKIKTRYSDSPRYASLVKNWGYIAIILVIIALIWSGYFLYQKYYITGKVNLNSKITGLVYFKDEPLYGVVVGVENGLQISTDEKGIFEIPKVKFGKRKFLISKDGYKPQLIEIYVWHTTMDLGKISLNRIGELDSSYSGRVLSSFDKKPISGAIVTLGPANRTSDESGGFNFTEMPKGEFTVHISAPGYIDVEEPVQLDPAIKAGKEYLLTPYGRISFTSARSGKRDIYTINYDGKNLKNHTQRFKGDSWDATFTSNGSKFVFFSDMGGIYDQWGQKQIDLYVADRNGENIRKLNKNDVTPIDKYVISGDGKKVAFLGKQRDSDETEVYLTDLEKGTDWIQLTDNDFTESDLAISGDGKMIAYEIINEEKREIVVMDVEKKEPKAISSDSSRETYLTFLKDGKKLLYARESIDFGSRLFVYDLEKEKEEEIFKTYSDISNLSLSGDSKKVLFTSIRDGKNAIYSFDLDGKREVLVSDRDDEYGYMHWTKSDSLLIFTITSGEVNKLAVMNLSNRAIIELEDVGDDAISWVAEGF